MPAPQTPARAAKSTRNRRNSAFGAFDPERAHVPIQAPDGGGDASFARSGGLLSPPVHRLKVYRAVDLAAISLCWLMCQSAAT